MMFYIMAQLHRFVTFKLWLQYRYLLYVRNTVKRYSTITKSLLATVVITNAKQKHLWCKKVRGQSEATLQTGRRDQKV